MVLSRMAVSAMKSHISSTNKRKGIVFNERFSFVPDLPMDREWTDEMLYKEYGITKKEIEFINSMIRPMGENDSDE
jgi:hypothetical protein